MNKFVHAEFLFTHDEITDGLRLISELGEDFIQLKSELDWDNEDTRGYVTTYNKVSGKISSAAATVIKLKDKFLSDRMYISYITEELKDKYRR